MVCLFYFMIVKKNQGSQVWRQNRIEMNSQKNYLLLFWPSILKLVIATKAVEFISQYNIIIRRFNEFQTFCKNLNGYRRKNCMPCHWHIMQKKKNERAAEGIRGNNNASHTSTRTATSGVFISFYGCYCRIIDGESTPFECYVKLLSMVRGTDDAFYSTFYVDT